MNCIHTWFFFWYFRNVDQTMQIRDLREWNEEWNWVSEGQDWLEATDLSSTLDN